MTCMRNSQPLRNKSNQPIILHKSWWNYFELFDWFTSKKIQNELEDILDRKEQTLKAALSSMKELNVVM